jgi:hypothetical protein
MIATDLSNEDADDDELVSGEVVSLVVNVDSSLVIRVTSWRLLVTKADGHHVASVPLAAIREVTVKHKRDLEIVCYDVRVLSLSFGENREAFASVRSALAVLPDLDSFFAFHNPQTGGRAPELVPYLEYKALPLPLCLREVSNKDFVLCSSYPEHLIVPAASDAAVEAVAAFRSRGRSKYVYLCFLVENHVLNCFFFAVPALCWLNSDNPGALLLRCSQPSRGFVGKSCREDEAMLGQFAELLFMDARPKAAAVGNATRGGGTESPKHYPGARLVFGDIGNIHAARKAHQNMVQAAVAESDRSWTSASAGWLEHVSRVLRSGKIVAEHLAQGRPAVVHCRLVIVLFVCL